MAETARSFSIEDFAHYGAEIAAELEAGNRLELIQGGKRIAEIVPSSARPTAEESEAAWQDLLRIMHEGIDLGGLKIEDRDELYDRD